MLVILKEKNSWGIAFIASLSAKTTGKDISDAVIKTFQIAEIDTSTIVSSTTDGAPSMIGRQAGFFSRTRWASNY